MAVMRFLSSGGVQRLALNGSGYLSLGNSDPVARLTINGVSMYDDTGMIISQTVTSSAIAVTQGSISVPYDSVAIRAGTATNKAQVLTPATAGRTPLVTCWALFNPLRMTYTTTIVSGRTTTTWSPSTVPIPQVLLFNAFASAGVAGFNSINMALTTQDGTVPADTNSGDTGEISVVYTNNYVWI